MSLYICIFLLMLIFISVYRLMKDRMNHKTELSMEKKWVVIIKLGVKVTLKHIKYFITCYVSLIGTYIIASRIKHSHVPPYNNDTFKELINIITSLEATEFIMYCMMFYVPIVYFIYVLPKDLLNIYDKWRELYNKEDIFVKWWYLLSDKATQKRYKK